MKYIIVPHIDLESIWNSQFYDHNQGVFVPYDYSLTKKNFESAYYFLSLILEKTFWSILNSEEDLKQINTYGFIYNNHFISLNSIELQKIDRDYNKILKFLCNSHENHKNILFQKPYSIKKKKCRNYCLNIEHLTERYKLVKISSKAIQKRIMVNGICNETQSSYKRLTKDLKSVSIDIDIKSISLTFYEKQVNQYLQYHSLINLYNKNYRISRNKNTDGRIHTNVTNMPKKFRKYLQSSRMNKFVGIDFSSSIFYALLIILTNHNKIKINNKFIKFYINHLILVKNAITLSHKAIEGFELEVANMYNMISKGDFYSAFISESNDASLQVKNIKKELIASLFRRYMDGKEIILSHKFPILSKIIHEFKNPKLLKQRILENQLSDLNPEYGHKYLSHLLFQAEAYIIYNIILQPIYRKFNDTTILTIHDSILVEKGYEEKLRLHIVETLKYHFSISPNLNIQYFDDCDEINI